MASKKEAGRDAKHVSVLFGLKYQGEKNNNTNIQRVGLVSRHRDKVTRFMEAPLGTLTTLCNGVRTYRRATICITNALRGEGVETAERVSALSYFTFIGKCPPTDYPKCIGAALMTLRATVVKISLIHESYN